jgi:hypothetical protein
MKILWQNYVLCYLEQFSSWKTVKRLSRVLKKKKNSRTACWGLAKLLSWKISQIINEDI